MSFELIIVLVLIVVTASFHFGIRKYRQYGTVLLSIDEMIPSEEHDQPWFFRSPGPNLVDFNSGLVIPPVQTLSQVAKSLAIGLPDIVRTTYDVKKRFSACTVVGNAGIGKTTMAKWLGLQLSKKGWLVFYASCGTLLNTDEIEDVIRFVKSKRGHVLLILDDAQLSPGLAADILYSLQNGNSDSNRIRKLRCLVLARKILFDSEFRNMSSNRTHLYVIAPPINMNTDREVSRLIHESIPEESRHLFRSLDSDFGMFRELYAMLRSRPHGFLIGAALDWCPMLMRGIDRQFEDIAKKVIGIVAVFSLIDCAASQDFVITQLERTYGRRDTKNVIGNLVRNGGLIRKRISFDGNSHMLSLRSHSQAKFVLEHPDRAQREASRNWLEVEAIGLIIDRFEFDLYLLYMDTNPPNLPEFLSRITTHVIEKRNTNLGTELLKSMGRLIHPSHFEQPYRYLVALLESQLQKPSDTVGISEVLIESETLSKSSSVTKTACLSIVVIIVGGLGVDMLGRVLELAFPITQFVVLTMTFLLIGIIGILVVSNYKQRLADEVGSSS